MNLILLEESEIEGRKRVSLDGRRARHILEVLGGEPGREVRVGVINGRTGVGTILEVQEDRVVLDVKLEGLPAKEPPIDLLLALPRPKVMKRLWSQISGLGVRRVFLVNAAKVERTYFATHWLEPEHYRQLLVEGLEQSGDTRLPEVRVVRRLKPFIEDETEALFGSMVRLAAHPAGDSLLPELRGRKHGGAVIAVGPEGGWNEHELGMLESHGFRKVSLGWRTLRTDVACVALVSVVRQFGLIPGMLTHSAPIRKTPSPVRNR